MNLIVSVIEDELAMCLCASLRYWHDMRVKPSELRNDGTQGTETGRHGHHSLLGFPLASQIYGLLRNSRCTVEGVSKRWRYPNPNPIILNVFRGVDVDGFGKNPLWTSPDPPPLVTHAWATDTCLGRYPAP